MWNKKKLDREKVEKMMYYIMDSASRWEKMDEDEKKLHAHWATNLLKELLD